MPESKEQRIATIEQKARILVERYREVVKQRDEAYGQIARMKEEAAVTARRIEEMETRMQLLTVASGLAPTPEQSEKAKAYLSELVWEIDKCITLLND